MKPRLLLSLLLASAAVTVVACGGGGGSNPVPTTTPTVTPTGTSTPAAPPSPLTTTAPLPSPNPGATQLTVTLPGVGGTSGATISANVTTPALVPPNTTYTATIGASATGAPTFPATLGTPLAYVSLTFNNDTVFGTLGPIAFSVTPAAGTNYYVAYYDPGNVSLGWQSNIFGAGSANGGTITFAPLNVEFDFRALSQYWFVIYGVSSSATQPVQTTPPGFPSSGCVGGPLVVKRHPLVSTSPYPVGNGDAFNYQGTYSETTAVAMPCPQPTASSSASVGIAVSESPTTAPDASSAIDVHSVEQDDFTLSGQQTTTTDATEKETSTQALLYGTTAADAAGNTVTTAYTTPLILDEFPEQSGNTWTNGDAGSVKESLADGSSVTRTIAVDGSYGETDVFGGQTATLSDTATDTGTYNVFGVYSLQYAAPVNGVITVTVSSGGAGKARDLLQWWKTGTPLYSDTFQDNGSTALPAACSGAVAVVGQSTGEQIVETISQLDPVLGYTDVRTTTRYDVPGFGPACVTIADTMTQYYDYQLNTDKSDYQSIDGTPVQTDTIAQTYWLNAAPTVNSVGRQPMNARSADLFIAGRVAAIAQQRAIERAAMIRAGIGR